MTTWTATATFRRSRWPVMALGLLGGTAGAYLLFVHLMQTSAPFAESVARISPELANAFSCTCPFCVAACQPPASEQGLSRFDNGLPSF